MAKMVADRSGLVRNLELSKVRNLRRKRPNCCATCLFSQLSGGTLWCLRPDGPYFDVGDGERWFYVCDRWESEYRNA